MNTSDQARQQWCPMVRMSTVAPVLVFQPDGKAKRSDIVGSFGGSANTGGESRRRNDPEYRAAADTRCVADECAMWRWIEPAPERRDAESWWPKDEDPVVEPPRPAELPPDAEWVPMEGEGEEATGGYWQEPDAVIEAEIIEAARARRGYCGLAGRPEVMP